MRKITLAISLLFGLSATVYSQEQTPQLLLHAAQCLEAKQFLPSSKATKLTLGYFLDEKSYPGTKEMYVVIYAAPARSNGLVFAIVLTQRGDREVFDIQNNASFVLSKDEPIGVSFVTPPTWRYMDAGAPCIGYQGDREAAQVCSVGKRPIRCRCFRCLRVVHGPSTEVGC